MENPSHGSSLAEFERLFVRPRAGRTLIVGSRIYKEREDRRLRYQDVLGVDMLSGPGVDVVANLEDAHPELGQFDHIECCSVLEHSARPWLLAAELQARLKPGGTLFVSAPFAWRVHGYPHDYWRFTAAGLRELFQAVEFSAVKYAGPSLWDPSEKPPMIRRPFPYLPRTEVAAFGVKACASS